MASFAEPERLRAYQFERRWPFMLWADPQRTLYRALGLSSLSWRRLLGWRTLMLYAKLVWRGGKIQRADADDVHQAGGDFLLDRHRRILYAHRSTEPADRPAIETLLAAVDRSRQRVDETNSDP